jgi:hypothetical protein
MLAVILTLIVAVIYFVSGGYYLLQGNWAMAIIWIGYAVSNIGLAWIGYVGIK